jgi:heme-degrading monooxygenase HmoA
MLRATLTMTVRPGCEDAFIQAWQEVANYTRYVPGNLRQSLQRDRKEGLVFTITSDWQDLASFTAYERSPEQDAITATLRDLRVSSQMSITDLLFHSTGGSITMPVRVMVFATIKPGTQEAFEAAFAKVTQQVKGTKGHMRDELIKDTTNPDAYILLSEWESREAFLAWEDAPIHKETTTPMRPYWAGRVERKIYTLAYRLDSIKV